jgi:hypothetical protein
VSRKHVAPRPCFPAIGSPPALSGDPAEAILTEADLRPPASTADQAAGTANFPLGPPLHPEGGDTPALSGCPNNVTCTTAFPMMCG